MMMKQRRPFVESAATALEHRGELEVRGRGVPGHHHHEGKSQAEVDDQKSDRQVRRREDGGRRRYCTRVALVPPTEASSRSGGIIHC